MCHGWKEPEYHPMVYKTKPCDFNEKDCPRLNSCSYYHNENEKRIITNSDQFCYTAAPRNRLVQGTYKVFLDDQLYGITDKNHFSQKKSDKRNFDLVMNSFTSLSMTITNIYYFV